MRTSYRQLALALSVLLSVSTMAHAGDWIAPQWNGNEPQFAPVPSEWGPTATKSAYIYRTTVQATPESLAVALRVKCRGYVYVRLNGKLAAEYVPAAPDDPKRNDPWSHPRSDLYWVQPSVDGAVNIVCRRGLQAGPNVLTLSAAPDGLAVEGGVLGRSGGTTRIATSPAWHVKKYPPTSILEHEAGLSDWRAPLGADWVRVGSDPTRGVSVATADLQAMAQPGLAQFAAEDLRNIQWRLDALLQQGYVIDDWEPSGFGGAGRIEPQVQDVARALRRRALATKPDDLAAIYELSDAVESITRVVRLQDSSTNLFNAAFDLRLKQQAVRNRPVRAAVELASLAALGLAHLKHNDYHTARRALDGANAKIETAYHNVEASTHNLVNRLNEADANRFGWFDTTRLLDNNVESWGVRVNPLEVSWKMDLNGLWRFREDPNNTGLKDTVHEPSYNIENQWDEIKVPGDWESQGHREPNPNVPADNPYKVNMGTDGPYNGYAWYRKTLYVPREWAGNDLELYISAVDDFDWSYFNGQELGHTGADNHPNDFWQAERHYPIPKELVKFGGYNVIAIRVYDARGTSYVGNVELRAPGLRETAEKRAQAGTTPLTSVYSSPLSVGALLTVGGDTLRLWGWNERGNRGPRAVVLPLQNGIAVRPVTATGTLYDRKTDGRLAANWALLWLDMERPEGDRPILLVFGAHPRSLTATVGEKGTAEIAVSYPDSGAQLVLARPFRAPLPLNLQPGAALPEDFLNRCRFWAQSLLAYPISFTEVNTRVAGDGKSLDITDIYNYRVLQNEWRIRPQRLALLPPFFSYAVKAGFPGVAFPQQATDLHYALGKYGDLKGVVGSDRVTYRIPLDPIPAFGGTTTFAFAGTHDINEKNAVEVKEVASYGANGWRPQTALPPGPELQASLDAGLKYHVNILHNASAGFVQEPPGKYEGVPPLYAKLAQAYADRPFWNISYDPFNEPADKSPQDYNPLVARTIAAIRQYDKKHLIYIEAPQSYASVLMMEQIAPTGDPLTVYSFHDYTFRLREFWPNQQESLASIYSAWFPAFEFMIERHAPIHCGEWGGYEQRKEPWVWSRPQTITETLDTCKIFQHFHMHFHYYSSRGTTRRLADDSIDQSFVQEAFARFFRRGHYNYYQDKSYLQ